MEGKLEKFKIEMTKDEMIRYYANKIVEDGIKEATEFNTTVDSSNYKEINKYKNEILKQIYRDERVADVNLDDDGNFDMVFYTDFCPYYYDSEKVINNNYFLELTDLGNLFNEFSYYYSEHCLFDNPYISMRNLLNQFANKQTDIEEKREEIVNIIKSEIIDSGFVDKHIEGVDVYITLDNYKELENIFEEKALQKIEEEEFG